ncbi:MAG: DUF6688 family protein, partial [Planctomycetota bacterium]
IVSGVPQALWYHVVLLLSFEFDKPLELLGYNVVPIVGTLGFLAIRWFLRFLHRRFNWPPSVVATTLAAFTIFLGAVLMQLDSGNKQAWAFVAFFPLAIPVACLAFGPSIALICYSVLTLRLMTVHRLLRRFQILDLFAWVTWIAGYLAACRYAIWMSLYQYEKLPKTPPSNCYVATAATQGHPRLVGSCQNCSGFPANDQLRTLKAFELAIRAVSPACHRVLRSWYDRVGPPVARRITNPWLADLCYVSLKPAEWIAAAMLRLALGRRTRFIRSLYRR